MNTQINPRAVIMTDSFDLQVFLCVLVLRGGKVYKVIALKSAAACKWEHIGEQWPPTFSALSRKLLPTLSLCRSPHFHFFWTFTEIAPHTVTVSLPTLPLSLFFCTFMEISPHTVSLSTCKISSISTYSRRKGKGENLEIRKWNSFFLVLPNIAALAVKFAQLSKIKF